MLFKLVGTVGIIASLAFASPVPESLPTLELQARGSSEGVHLTDCDGVVVTHGQGDTRYSVISYYSNDYDAQNNNNQPTDVSNTVASQGWAAWEGNSITGSFKTGVKFTSYINGGAKGTSLGTKVGTGYNGANWNCYKDNGRVLFYTDSNQRGACHSMYYCLKP